MSSRYGLAVRTGRSDRERQAGYNLVGLVVIITVLNILIAKALPLWSGIIQREKEEELIFRGMQYAEALRIFEARTGALPTKMEQLIEVKPRCIRQLWKNPLAEDGSWLLIPPGQGQRLRGQDLNPQDQELERQGRDRARDQGRGALPGDPSRPDPSLLWVPGGDSEIGSVAIFGVKSSVGGESIKTFVTNPNAPGGGGSNEISDWHFTVELAKSLILQVDPSNPMVPSMNVAQRFKPWPPGIRPIIVPRGANQEGRGGSGGTHAIERPGRPNTKPDQDSGG